MKILIALLLAFNLSLFLTERASPHESMASHERSREPAHDNDGNTPQAPEGGWTDAEFELNQYNAENDVVDTSVDSCAGGCVTPTDIDTDISGGGL